MLSKPEWMQILTWILIIMVIICIWRNNWLFSFISLLWIILIAYIIDKHE